MAILKTEKKANFRSLQRNAPFAVNMTLYTRTDNREDPKEHILFKLNDNKAITIDKRTTLHFTGEEEVIMCEMERKEKKKLAA
jgi:hypothetical protein